MKRHKVLFVDLLYSEGGSLDEDMRSITQAVSIDHDVEYLRFDERASYRAIGRVFFQLFKHRYDKIIFLSCKVSQLFPLALLRLATKCYVIYHFMPSHRKKFHKKSLHILSRFFVIGVYSSGVADQIEDSLGFRPDVLPSRIIDRKSSLALLREKLAQNQVRVLVPGLRPGVRKEVSLAPISEFLEQRLGYKLEGIYVQGEIPDLYQASEFVRKVGNLPQAEYDQLYNSSLIVVINFHEDYEVRASGVILDALRSGSLILTFDHPIVRQYGFPNSMVSDLEGLESLLATLSNCSDEQALALIPGSDYDEFRRKWCFFLK